MSNQARLRVVKARKFGRSGGKLCYLRYDPTTGRLLEADKPSDFEGTNEEKPNGEW